MAKHKSEIFPMGDVAKRSLFLPKLLLESVCLWPENRTKLVKSINWILIILITILETGHAAFVVKNMKNFSVMISAISTVSTTFQAIIKFLVLYVYADELETILGTIWHQFWPANIAPLGVIKELSFYSAVIIITEISMCVVGILFAFGFLSSPLISGRRVLPFESIYPFNFAKSPVYEIIYVTQWFTNMAVILVGIIGHDCLFIGICSNIIAQYILLGQVTGYLGLKHRKKNAFLAFDCANDAQLLANCVDHHALLMQIAKKTGSIFSFSCFIQLFSSVTALCVSALIVTFVEPDFGILTTVAAYILGHLTQLFLFCMIGNELIYYVVNEFPNAVFNSFWYDADVNVQKKLILVVAQAQRQVKITALNIKVVDFQTFIGVLRLSFSFYTMLSRIADYND